MKSLNRKIFVCLAPVVIGLLVVSGAFWNYTHAEPLPFFKKKFKLGVDLVGGTILVYEIDPEKKPENYNKDQLVAALRRRIDPAGLRDIVIRAVSDTRVEIIVSTGGQHEVEYIKELISRVGSLEFRILANKHDDPEAIKAAEAYFSEAVKSWKAFLDEGVKKKWPDVDKTTDKDKLTLADVSPGDMTTLSDLIRKRNPKVTEADVNQFLGSDFKPSKELNDLIKRNRAELPPPPPEGPDGKTFKINLEDGEHRVSYSWVEIGKSELDSLGLLYSVYRKDLDRIPALEKKGDLSEPEKTELETARHHVATWKAVQRYRHQGATYDANAIGSRLGEGEWASLSYSRKVLNPKLLPKKDSDKKYEYFVLTRNTEPGKEVTGEHLTSAKEGAGGKGDMAVNFGFNPKGANLFRELTTANKPPANSGGRRHLAIVLDAQVMSAPSLNAIISDAGQITGKFTKDQIDMLVNILRSGALPATLKPQPVSENTMGATLGEDTIRAGTTSIGLAFVAVLLFMLFYYRFAGFVACVALLGNLILTVAFMVAVNATFTLPGLAGLVLTLAMAVDANVLIYERLREERDRGASLPLAIRNGYDRAFPTVIDTHMSSIFTAIVLYIVGNDQLRGFGISLTVGLIISLFTALYVTRTFFDLWQSRGWLKKLSMARLLTRTRINFMGIRYFWFTTTVLLTVFGISVFLIRGKAGLNMDFVGGTIYSGVTKDFLTIAQLRDKLENEERQKDLLALDGDPQPIPERDGYFTLVYAKDHARREVYIPEKITPAQLKERAQTLPDVSLELIYHSDAELSHSQEGTSKLFTVRTTEKAADLVSAAINRLLAGELKTTTLKDYTLDQVTLLFSGPVPLAQARSEVEKALKTAGIIKGGSGLSGLLGWALEAGSGGEALTLVGEAEEAKKGFKTAVLTLKQRVDGEQLAQALTPLMHQSGLLGWALEVAGARDEGALLKRYQLTSARIDLDDFAYPSQVRALLETQLRGLRVPQINLVEAAGAEENNGRYKRLELTLPVAVDGDRFNEAMRSFATELKNRPLPARLENFDSALAADMQQRALYAILASWGAMLLYLWFRFGNWTFGLAAVLCLIHDLFFTMGIIAFCHYLHGTFFGDLLAVRDFKIDLPAVAALLTLVGYSVNDTIVVFDRIREVRGKNPHLTPEMINDSVNQTLSRTVLTSVITWLVVLVLYIWGGEGVHLFSFVMVVGVVIGTYSSIYVASPLLLILGEGAPEKGARVPQDRLPAVSEG